ncbi:hypothetical protein JCM6882_007661 [Rhodosporidiobolus microsporus]
MLPPARTAIRRLPAFALPSFVRPAQPRPSLHSLAATGTRAFTASALRPDGPKLRMILLGAPGAGKGTLSDYLLDEFEIESVVVGQLLREEILNGTELGREAERVMKEGALLSDDLVLQVVEPALDKLRDKNWLLDGFPRKASQAALLDSMLEAQNERNGSTGHDLNFVASLKVPDEVIVKRIADRYIHLPSGRTYNLSFNPPNKPGLDDVTGEPLSQRPDDDASTVRTRLRVFHAENDPLLAHYAGSGKMAVFEGRTSKEIWPRLEGEVLKRFPGLKRRTTPRTPA